MPDFVTKTFCGTVNDCSHHCRFFATDYVILHGWRSISGLPLYIMYQWAIQFLVSKRPEMLAIRLFLFPLRSLYVYIYVYIYICTYICMLRSRSLGPLTPHHGASSGYGWSALHFFFPEYICSYTRNIQFVRFEVLRRWAWKTVFFYSGM
jgi:hypothetical protein